MISLSACRICRISLSSFCACTGSLKAFKISFRLLDTSTLSSEFCYSYIIKLSLQPICINSSDINWKRIIFIQILFSFNILQSNTIITKQFNINLIYSFSFNLQFVIFIIFHIIFIILIDLILFLHLNILVIFRFIFFFIVIIIVNSENLIVVFFVLLVIINSLVVVINCLSSSEQRIEYFLFQWS